LFIRFPYKHCNFLRLPTGQVGVENHDKAYLAFVLRALYYYTTTWKQNLSGYVIIVHYLVKWVYGVVTNDNPPC